MAKKEQTKYQQLKEKFDGLNEKMRDVSGKTSEYIEENPVASALVAFGIGVVAGAVVAQFMRRR